MRGLPTGAVRRRPESECGRTANLLVLFRLALPILFAAHQVTIARRCHSRQTTTTGQEQHQNRPDSGKKGKFIVACAQQHDDVR